MKCKLMILFWMAALLLGACNMPMAVGGGPKAWIDDPLDGMRLPLKPYTLTLHSSDPHGISRMEVTVNGNKLATLTNPDPSQLLVYLTQPWEPSAPGRYIIRTRAQNTAGIWSAEDLVTVEIEGITTTTPTPTPVITITPTPVITFTPTPVITFTPTPVITFTPTPPPAQQSAFTGLPVFNPEQVDLGRGCPATSLTAEIKVTSTQSINVVVLFFRVTDIGYAEHTEWADIGMHSVGSNTYRVTFNPFQAGDFASWLTAHWSAGWEGWLTTQFVIQQKDGSYTRSDVYSQVKIADCH